MPSGDSGRARPAGREAGPQSPPKEPQEVPALATTVCTHAQKCAPSLDATLYLPQRFTVGSLSSQPPGWTQQMPRSLP